MPWLPLLAKLGGLSCAGGKVFPCRTQDGGHDPHVCASHKREWNGVAWPTCPTRSIIEDTHVRYVLQLERQSQTAALAGIPRPRQAAWVPRALAALAHERAIAGPKLKALGIE